MITIKDILIKLEAFAPPVLQENYDNAGLIVGDSNEKVKGVLISLDTTVDVVNEAINKGCNLIISHHPIVFSGLKKLTGANYIERVVILAIKNNIAIYAIHTNLDNMAHGVNKMIADRLGLINTNILAPKKNQLLKLVVFVPSTHAETVRNSLFKAGAGNIGNYAECSFNSAGEGTYKANEKANPYKGEIGKRHFEKEIKIEVVVPVYLKSRVISEMINAHPYEDVAYDLIAIENEISTVGSGMIGELAEPVDEKTFLKLLKTKMKTKCIRHTKLLNKPVKRVALIGGSGSFLLQQAKAKKADVFITGDVKYHEFFDAEDQLVIADIGHYESEQFTIDLIGGFLIENFSKFAVRFTEVNTNPINYY